MTTFQAIVLAAIHGLTQFFPLSPQAHEVLIPYLIDWQAPTGPLLGAFSAGSFLALLIYFRHDWASMISCFLQVILFRKRPMTLDERLPLFLTASTLPVLASSYYFQDQIPDTLTTPVMISAILALVGFGLLLADYLSKKSKGMFDLNWLDAIFVGLVQATALLPGWDFLTAAFFATLFLNYRRDAAAKYAYFAAAPLLLSHSLEALHGVSLSSAAPAADLSWLSFSAALVMSCLVGLLAIGGLLRHFQHKGIKHYVVYRWVLAITVCAVYWMRNR